jgi:putative tricarboxylic transport membrane protein
MALGVVWLHGALNLPRHVTYAVIGPGVFPGVIGAGLLVLGGLLVLAVARGERFAPQEAEDADPDRPPSWTAFGLTLLAAALPVVTIKPLGFPLAAAISFALVTRGFGSARLWLDAAIGLTLGLGSWLLFARLLGLGLPGPLPAFPG